MESVAKEIAEFMNKILSYPTYIGVFNDKGKAIYKDNQLEEHSQFISSFIKENFKLLVVGDHSIPLSGLNLAFFKISDQSMIILHTKEGPVGQLLAFKSRMLKYSEKIDAFFSQIKEAEIEKAAVIKEKTPIAAERIPVLEVPIDKKKFPLDEASVLHTIDGKVTITEICEKINLPRLKVNEILKKYQKRGWVRLKRVIGGTEELESKKVEPGKTEIELKLEPTPQISESKEQPKLKEQSKPVVSSELVEKPKPIEQPKTMEAPKVTQTQIKSVPFSPEMSKPKKVTKPVSTPLVSEKPIPEIDKVPATKLAIQELESKMGEEIIYLFPILIEEDFKNKVPKNEQNILDLCDGRNTIEDIRRHFSLSRVELMSILRKYQKKNVLKITRIIPGTTKEPIAAVTQKKAIPKEIVEKQVIRETDIMPKKVEGKVPLKTKEELLQETTIEPPQEESMIDDKEFEKTLIDLDNILEKTEMDIDIDEVKSFGEALTELTGLLDNSNIKEESQISKNFEQPINKVENTKLTETPVSQEKIDIKPKYMGTQLICTHCGAAIPSTKKICPQCGHPIKSCPHCNAPISIHTRICPECSGLINE